LSFDSCGIIQEHGFDIEGTFKHGYLLLVKDAFIFIEDFIFDEFMELTGDGVTDIFESAAGRFTIGHSYIGHFRAFKDSYTFDNEYVIEGNFSGGLRGLWLGLAGHRCLQK
jgi:hypothetical protein